MATARRPSLVRSANRGSRLLLDDRQGGRSQSAADLHRRRGKRTVRRQTGPTLGFIFSATGSPTIPRDRPRAKVSRNPVAAMAAMADRHARQNGYRADHRRRSRCLGRPRWRPPAATAPAQVGSDRKVGREDRRGQAAPPRRRGRAGPTPRMPMVPGSLAMISQRKTAAAPPSARSETHRATLAAKPATRQQKERDFRDKTRRPGHRNKGFVVAALAFQCSDPNANTMAWLHCISAAAAMTSATMPGSAEVARWPSSWRRQFPRARCRAGPGTRSRRSRGIRPPAARQARNGQRPRDRTRRHHEKQDRGRSPAPHMRVVQHGTAAVAPSLVAENDAVGQDADRPLCRAATNIAAARTPTNPCAKPISPYPRPAQTANATGGGRRDAGLGRRGARRSASIECKPAASSP